MKCPRGFKCCKSLYRVNADNDAFICSGLSTEPTQYEHDVIWICHKKGTYLSQMEYTVDEAAFVIGALSTAVAAGTEFYRKIETGIKCKSKHSK